MKRKAISLILSSALILQSSATMADSNIKTEKSKPEISTTSVVDKKINICEEKSDFKQMPTSKVEENLNMEIEKNEIAKDSLRQYEEENNINNEKSELNKIMEESVKEDSNIAKEEAKPEKDSLRYSEEENNKYNEKSELSKMITSESEKDSNIQNEDDKLEISTDKVSVTTAQAIIPCEQVTNEYTDKLQQKINDVLAKIEEDKKNGTVFAEKELDKELYLLSEESHDSLAYLNEVIESAKKLIEENSTDKEAIEKASDLIDEVYDDLRTIETYDSFSGIDGLPWKDTNGVKIQAHGGQVQKLGDKWWWYGEDKTKGYRSNGISAYSSDDLYNWDFEGFVMRTIKDRDELDNNPYFTELYGDYNNKEKDRVFQAINGGYWLNGEEAGSVVERPKMIYNEKTGKYVIWFHADGPTHDWPNTNYASACAGVAISDTPNGPFKFIDRYRLNTDPDTLSPQDPGMARDMNLFIDDDKTAYIVYSSEQNATMYISKLNEDYTCLTKTDMTKAIKNEDYTDIGHSDANKGVKGEDYARIFANWHREAPALFKYNGKYYIISSGTSGWSPNQAKYAVADDILGEWTEIGDPCVNDSDRKTFYSQSTNVINYDKESGKLIYMGDRWKEWDLGDSRYIWLPLEFDIDGNLSIKPYTNWKLEDLKNKNTVHINTELKDIYTSVKDLPKTLNVKVFTDDDSNDEDIKVTWDTSNLKSMEKGTVTGIMNIDGRKISVQANLINIPENLKYYIDCGAKNGSDIYDLVKDKVENKDSYDQAYSGEGSWGYNGKIGEDIQYYNEENKDSYESGYWAYKNKPISYKVSLEAGKYKLSAGFNEWWNENRNMKISIAYKDINGNNVEKQLGDFWNDGKQIVGYDFDLPNKCEVTIKVSKLNSPDVILSWLAIESNNVEVIKDGMKDLYTEVSELPSEVNVKVFENGNWVEKNSSVKWDVPKLEFLEKTKVTGTLSEGGKEITVDFMYIPKDLQYYIDCGAKNGSTTYDLIKEKVELKNNEACDKAYTEGSWGVVSKLGEDINYHNADNKNAFESGFYAEDDKSIDYVVPLKAGSYKLFAGFKEWWEDYTLYRGLGISVSYKDSNGKTVKKELGSGVLIDKLILDSNFDIPEDSDVTISIHMFNHEEKNVVLSWLAIEKNGSTIPWTNVTKAAKTDVNMPMVDLTSAENSENVSE